MIEPKRIVVLVLAGVVLLAVLQLWDRATTARLENGVDQVRHALAQHKGYARQQEELKRQRDVALATAATHRARWQEAERGRGALDFQLSQVKDTAALVRTLRAIVRNQDSVITGLKAENISLYTALAISRAQADSAAARVAQLEQASRALLKGADCHLLGLGFLPRCPSRTTSFFLGAGTATAAIVLTR